MVSYVPKNNKSVLLLTSSCLNTNVENTEARKPEVILHYNRYNGGVDTVDRIISTTSVKRYTNRWPTAVFYDMIDISLINSFHIYKKIFSDPTCSRFKFLEELAGILLKTTIFITILSKTL